MAGSPKQMLGPSEHTGAARLPHILLAKATCQGHRLPSPSSRAAEWGFPVLFHSFYQLEFPVGRNFPASTRALWVNPDLQPIREKSNSGWFQRKRSPLRWACGGGGVAFRPLGCFICRGSWCIAFAFCACPVRPAKSFTFGLSVLLTWPLVSVPKGCPRFTWCDSCLGPRAASL